MSRREKDILLISDFVSTGTHTRFDGEFLRKLDKSREPVIKYAGHFYNNLQDMSIII